MKRKFIYLFIISVLLFTANAFPQEMQERKIVLTEIIQEALTNSPRVIAAYQDWQATLKNIPQVKSLPDPMFSYSYFGQSIETRLGPQRNKISISQKLPFFGKLSLKGKIAEKNASVIEEQYKAVKADIVLSVKEAFYTLYWIDKALLISRQEKDILHRFAKIAQKKYETGQGSQQDILKAYLEISKVSEKILILNQRRKAIATEMNFLLNRPPDSFVGEAEEIEIADFEVEIEELYLWAQNERPELRKAQSFIEKNSENLRLASKNYYPDFNLMFDYIDIGGGRTINIEDGRNAWMVSVGVNIPLWRKKLHAAKAEAAINLRATKERYAEMKNATYAQINELIFEITTAKERIELYKSSLLPQAEQSLKASEAGYLTGKVDFLNLLDSERMILQLKTNYFKAIADYGKNLAQLERVIGKDLS